MLISILVIHSTLAVAAFGNSDFEFFRTSIFQAIGPARIRTLDQWIMSPLLYRTELRALIMRSTLLCFADISRGLLFAAVDRGVIGPHLQKQKMRPRFFGAAYHNYLILTAEQLLPAVGAATIGSATDIPSIYLYTRINQEGPANW